jgi:hypothetical protein
MADEEQTVDETDTPAEAAGTAPETTAEETALTSDGSPNGEEKVANWREALPDDIKTWAEKFDSPTTALKSYRELEKKMGRSVAIPGKDATPEEVQAFRKKLGVPDAPTDYKLNLPDHVPQEVRDDPMSDPLLKRFVETSHANGKTPAQVQADLAVFYEAMSEMSSQAEREAEQRTNAGLDELRRDWGSDFDANATYAKRTLNQFDDDGGFKGFLNTEAVGGVKLGDHPAFIRFFAKIGRAMTEDSVQLEPTADERQSANDEAAKLREQRNEALRRGDRAAAQRFDQAEREVYARMGNQPIVGARGRAA